MATVLERRNPQSVTTLTAAVVIGLELRGAELSEDDIQAAAERLARSVRPWDTVVPLGPGVIGVLCTALSTPREVDAVAVRLADALRAPMAVGEEIHQLGVCHGSSEMSDGDTPDAVFTRAQAAMQHMRAARARLLGSDLPAPRTA